MDPRHSKFFKVSCFYIYMVLTLSACDIVHTDKDGSQNVTSYGGQENYGLLSDVKDAIAASEAMPTDEGFKKIASAVERSRYPSDCTGKDKSDYILAYRSIAYLNYQYNNYPVTKPAVANAVNFLKLCIEYAPLQLVGPSLVGIGMNGTREDADVIFNRAMKDHGQELLTYAAMGLKFNCNSIADDYLDQLVAVAANEEVRKAIQVNIENRRLFRGRCPSS